MRKLIFLSIISMTLSCNKSDDIFDIPICIQECIDNPVEEVPLLSVRAQEQGDEIHYWLNTDVDDFAVEIIVNAECEALCLFCEACIPAPRGCYIYDDDNWTIIWEN